jgi:DNA replication and repair protein RecF
LNVKKIRLINFRNLVDLSINFDSSLNVFIGNNAQGKTNIIESIYTLMRGNSYRTTDDRNLINWNKRKCYILGEIQLKEENFQISILLDNNGKIEENSKNLKKTIKLNKKYHKKSVLLKKFNPVIFSPEDLQIIKSAPSLRRKFLDDVIINIYPVYYQYLKNYNRILFQRNTLLKKERTKSETNNQLAIWDQKITELGTLIILYRIKILKNLNQKAKIFHQMMSENKETIKLKYNSNILADYTDDENTIRKIMQSKLEIAREKDFQLKVTTVGPHRDDFYVMNNIVDLGIYGSQGQQRTAVLSLKLAALELFKEKENEYPPLLLDDVMSELDLERKVFLLKLIKERAVQTFITSIDLDRSIQTNIIKSSKMFRVKNGELEKNGT